MNIDLPLISCLCVTREKPEFLTRVIQCFLSQTYPSKELVIVYEDDDPPTRRLVRTLKQENIRILEVPSHPKKTLGELRNISVQASKGTYFCQWDDDDWYHNLRLEVQMNAIINNHKEASILAYWLMYDTVNNEAFLSLPNPWPGTILCHRNIFGDGLVYEARGRSEDTAFLVELMRRNCLMPVVMPSLYIYTYHARNTWGYSHFGKMFSLSQRLPPEVCELFRKIFSGELSNDEASRLMLGRDVLGAIDYFQQYKAEPLEY